MTRDGAHDSGFHIIKLEGKRTEEKDGKKEEQVHARHILIGGGGQSDNPMAPPRSGRDKARAEVEKEKQKKILDEIVKRSHVTVAENFTVTTSNIRFPCFSYTSATEL